jgi:hypothetical protein
VYIICKGLAKNKREPKIVEQKNGDILEEIDDDDLEVDTTGYIVKPVLWREYGVTPKFIVDLVAEIRAYLAKKLGKERITNSLNDMQLVRSRYLKKTIDNFDKLWEDSGIKFFNKTHTWRKSYCDYSHQLYNRNGNSNLWIMMVLGHTRIETSFSYANLIVVQYVTLQDEDLKVEYSRLKADYASLAVKVEQQAKQIKFLMSRSQENVGGDIDDSEEADEYLVSVPSVLGNNVNVKPFDIARKNFKKDEQKAKDEWQNTYQTTVVDNLTQSQVDISQLTEEDLTVRLKVLREIARKIRKEHSKKKQKT